MKIRCNVKNSQVTILRTLSFPVEFFNLQFVWLVDHQEEMDWCKFITTRHGAGSAMTSGTSKTLMWFVENLVTRALLRSMQALLETTEKDQSG